MNPLLMIVLIFFGVMAGLLGGFLGIGGCVIMLPALYFIFNYPLPLAIGTTITAVIITALSGAIGHIRIRNVDYSTVWAIAISGGLGAAVGSLVFLFIAGQTPLLNAILGVAFIYVSVRMLYEGLSRRKLQPKTGDRVPGSKVSKFLLGFGIGVITGIVGLGGGYVLVPSFIYLLNAPVKIAVGTSLASFLSMAVISSGFKLVQGVVDPIAAVSLGAGTAIGAQIGARLVPRTPTWLIKSVFGTVFLYVSIRFILAAFGIRI